jgi:hypothetical protein
MSWSFVLDHGGDISNLVDTRSITRNMRLHTDMKANVNKLAFRVKYDATLFGTLLSYDTIELTVLDGSTPYFYGYLSPNYKATIRDGQKYITMIAEDPTLQLLGQIIADPWAKAGYAVCNPAAPSTSLVHAICTAAGVTLATGTPTISATIPYVVVLPEDKLAWAKLLEQILFEYGYVYSFDASGELVLYPTINPSTVTATGTLTTASGTANIRGEIEIDKSPEKYDDIRINYDLVELKTGITVFKDQDVIDIAATGDTDGKDYYPLTSKLGEVFSSWNSPDGYDIWVVTSPVLSATLGSGVTLDTALTNYYRKASFAYKNSSASASTITGLSMTGNAYVIASKNTARSSVASAKRLYDYQAKYIYSDAAAEALAEKVGQYYKYSDIKYRIKSTDSFDLGEYIDVVDAIYAGLSTKCRVVGITQHEAPTVVYEYALEGVDDFVAITIVTEGGHDGIPTPSDFGTSDYYANTPPTNNVASLAFSSAQNPNGNIDITVEWTYTQGAVTADGFLVYYKRAITTPGTINLNEDPSVFVPVSSTAGAVDYSTVLTLPTRQSGAGSIPIHYRFGVVAFGTRRSGTVPHAGGVVEDAGWLDEVFAADMTDMVIRSYKGQGVQRRAIQIDAESIDFIDTPDTSPATDEQLRFRLGRLGVGGAVLADGEMLAELSNSWSGELVVNAAASSTPALIQTVDGGLRIAYRRNSDSYLVERIWSGTAWGSETVVNAAASYRPSYVQRSDGQIRLAYQTGSLTPDISERIWSGSAWGTASSVTTGGNSYGPSLSEDASGVLRIAYTLYATNALVERTWSGSAWSAESTVASGSLPSYALDGDGVLHVAYTRTSDSYLVEKTWSGSAWGSETVINAANSAYCSYVRLVNDELRIAYRRDSDGYLVERTFSGTAWGSESVINAANVLYPALLQLANGDLVISYARSSDDYLVERTLQRYARVGAGIIESGSNANGYYVKFSDGTVQQWGTWSVSGGSATTFSFTISYPVAFTSTPYVNAVRDSLTGLHYWVLRYATPGLSTASVVFIELDVVSRDIDSTGSWYAIGRWY